MRRRVARILQASAAATGAALVAGAFQLVPPASAAPAGATGYATQNGGTTGGAGGQTVRATTGTQIHQALCGRAASSTPIVIQVEGTVNHGNTTKVSGASCNTAADRIELKDVSNITIVGVGSGAVFDQLGIHLRNARNVIIQNVTVRNVKKSGSPTSNGGDAIGMETDVSNVWVDHATLEASGGEDAGFDGLFDLKDNSRYVTLSYSILRNSGRGGLIGSSDSDTSSTFVTFHHNLYQNIDSRTPLLRGGTAHAYDNYYVGLKESGINPRAGGKARVDNNYFKNSKDVLGTFYTDLMGSWQVSGNVFDNVTWSSPGTENHPAGPNPTSTTSISIPYSFALDAATCVPQLVTGTAGAGTGLKVSDGSCTPTTPAPTTPAPTTPGPTTPAPTTPRPTSTPTPTAPSGTNLSLGAGADGSSKGGGTSYGNVRDGDLSTYWSPNGSTGDISVKWGSATTVGTAVVREASGAVGVVTAWQLVNADTGAVLASGSRAGTASFSPIAVKKLTFRITAASGTPRIAEFETYAR